MSISAAIAKGIQDHHCNQQVLRIKDSITHAYNNPNELLGMHGFIEFVSKKTFNVKTLENTFGASFASCIPNYISQENFEAQTFPTSIDSRKVLKSIKGYCDSGMFGTSPKIMSSIEIVLGNVFNDPKKLLEMPALVQLAHRGTLDAKKLEAELGVKFAGCITISISEDLITKKINALSNVPELFTMINGYGIHDGVGLDAIKFCLDQATLTAINANFDHLDLTDEYIGSVNSCFNV